MSGDNYMEEYVSKEYTGCGCPTCKSMNVACKDCPVCSSDMDKDVGCPPATQDIALNLKNRKNAIDTAMYGPLNPAESNEKYWAAIGSEWGVDSETAKKQRCGNCAVFIKTPEMLSCIKEGLTESSDEFDSIDAAGELGYCEAFDFKCASARTCRAWVAGGPVTKAVIDAEGFFEGSLQKDSPCWDGFAQRGMKPGKNGGMVPNCVPVKEANEIDKAREVSVGDHVTFGVPKPPDKTEYAHGVVESISRSGVVTVPGTDEKVEATDSNPVAIVRVWAIGDSGKLSRTDRKVGKPFSSLTVLTTSVEEATVNVQKASKALDSRLSELAANYNKNKEGNKRITLGALRQVYNRGIGAYRTNPSSVRGTVSSAEQWAMGRVNAFMAGLRGRFPRKSFDLDLFPKGHPRSTKKSEWSGSAFDIKSGR